MNPKNFFAEVKRRNVYKVAVAYAVVAWLVVQIASTVLPTFHSPEWVVQTLVLLVLLGFPIALVLAWAFELTPEGIRRSDEIGPTKSKGRAWIYIAIAAAALSIGLFFLGRFTAPSKPVESTEVPSKSIAVLPFESLSEDKSNAYFAEGIQDQILTRLSKIADLKVISRTSTEKYKSAPNNLREIAQQLGVANILEGSVQKSGEQVRITVQLINALKDDHLWADTYDRTMSNIFSVETDVAQKIAESLEAKLTGREKKDIAFVGTKNPQAYDAFLHALALRGAQSFEDSVKQREFCERAIQLDPGYAQAWALLGEIEALGYFSTSSEEQKEKARFAVARALQLAPDLAESRMANGAYNYYCLGSYEAAVAELRAAQERAPNIGGIQFYIGLVQRRQGKFEESIRQMEEAAVLDPLNPDIAVNLGATYRGQRKFEAARAMYDRALAIAPDEPNIIADKAEAYLAQGDIDTAWAMVSKLRHTPNDYDSDLYMELLGKRRQLDELLSNALPILAKEENYSPVLRKVAHAAIANLYLFKGDRQSALPLMEKVRQDREEMQKNGGINWQLYNFYIELDARLGDRAAVEQDIQELFAKTRNDKWALPNSQTTAAVGYVLLGDFDRAIPYLQEALSQPSFQSVTSANLRLDPIWDSIRNDPRFQKLAESKP